MRRPKTKPVLSHTIAAFRPAKRRDRDEERKITLKHDTGEGSNTVNEDIAVVITEEVEKEEERSCEIVADWGVGRRKINNNAYHDEYSRDLFPFSSSLRPRKNYFVRL